MVALPRITDDERRRRIAVRHGLAARARFGSLDEAVRGLGALHATDHATVHLTARARVDGYRPADLDDALGVRRSVVKQPAMRNTLFVAARERLPDLLGSASARIAGPEERRLAKALLASGTTRDPAAWLTLTTQQVLDALSEGPLSAPELRAAVPTLDLRVNVAPGTRWGRDLPTAQYVLSVLCARGVLVRATGTGPWHRTRPTYAAAGPWWGDVPDPSPVADGYRALVGDWLSAFGPGREDDLVWWLGSTRTAARAALAALEAVEVALDDGSTAWVLPGDTGDTDAPGPWAALLPLLDPTTMGWRARAFYLSPKDVPYLVDSVGNASTTAWVDGRVVGCWVQEEDGRVRVVPRRTLTAHESQLLDAEAERLDAFLAGTVLGLTYNRPQSEGRRLP